MKLQKVIAVLLISIAIIALLSTMHQRHRRAIFQQSALNCCPIKIGDSLEQVRSTWGEGSPIGQPGDIPHHEGLTRPNRKISNRCELFAADPNMACDEFLSGGYFIYFDHNNIVEYIYFGNT